MTAADHTPQQQLAGFLERERGLHPGAASEDAAAIVAAVEAGTLPPIVPNGWGVHRQYHESEESFHMEYRQISTDWTMEPSDD